MINISNKEVLHEIETLKNTRLSEYKNMNIVITVQWTGNKFLPNGFLLSGTEGFLTPITTECCFAQETFSPDETEEEMIPKIEAMMQRAKDEWDSLPNYEKKLS